MEVSKIKKRAAGATSGTKSRKIIASTIKTITPSAAAALPNMPSLSRIVQRVRHKVNPQLPTPPNRESLEIPELFTMTTKGTKFLFHDSGGKNRFLIFTTQANLQYLASCSLWLSDGTFNAVPSIFTQLYTLHGCKIDDSHPQHRKSLPLV